jgi:hypothetical protein
VAPAYHSNACIQLACWHSQLAPVLAQRAHFLHVFAEVSLPLCFVLCYALFTAVLTLVSTLHGTSPITHTSSIATYTRLYFAGVLVILHF